MLILTILEVNLDVASFRSLLTTSRYQFLGFGVWVSHQVLQFVPSPTSKKVHPFVSSDV